MNMPGPAKTAYSPGRALRPSGGRQHQGERYEEAFAHDFTCSGAHRRAVLAAVSHIQRLVEFHAPVPGDRHVYPVGGGAGHGDIRPHLGRGAGI